MNLSFVLSIILLVGFVSCDVQTNCTYEETVGDWVLYIGHGNLTNQEIDCNNNVNVTKTIRVTLLFPDHVADEFGNEGTWTMVYNQGFEIKLGGRKYFAFQYCDETAPKQWTSYCDQTFNGWSHDLVVNNQYPPLNWACYFAKKKESNGLPKVSPVQEDLSNIRQLYGLQHEFVESINNHQSLWTAGVYEEYENMTLSGMINRAGGRKTMNRIPTRPVDKNILKLADDLPPAFDYRNVNGRNFITPVRNQGECGSCYAYGSMAQLEASFAIQTGKPTKVFSTQNIVSCSVYSQGCEGGFPYLIAGMYGQDFGVIEEETYPYVGNDTKCNAPKDADRTFTQEYGYVGGFYGGCNEALMRIELVKTGPIVIGFLVTDEFQHYKGGIFVSTGLKLSPSLKFNPLESTNHAVLVVGYGVESGVKYWIVKNSWGPEWGEKGYFRIRRGTDELGIESLGVYAKAYLNNRENYH